MRSTITFRTVLIDPQYYDLTGDLDVRIGGTRTAIPPGTDQDSELPDQQPARDLVRGILYHRRALSGRSTRTDEARPEDLDFDIVGRRARVYPDQHRHAVVDRRAAQQRRSRGERLRCLRFLRRGHGRFKRRPAGCTATTNPPPMPEWRIPGNHPGDSVSVYVCDRGTIGPGKYRERSPSRSSRTARRILRRRPHVPRRRDRRDPVERRHAAVVPDAPAASRRNHRPRQQLQRSTASGRASSGTTCSRASSESATENNPPPERPGRRDRDWRGVLLPRRVWRLVWLPYAGLHLHRRAERPGRRPATGRPGLHLLDQSARPEHAGDPWASA